MEHFQDSQVATNSSTETHAQSFAQSDVSMADSEHAKKKPRLENTEQQPTTSTSQQEEEQDRAQLLRLMEQKTRIEEEIKNLEDVLESQQRVGMSGALLDADGYPRADIDLYAVRYARNRVICLNNDHKALMKQIEAGLFSLHDKYKRSDTGSASKTIQKAPEAKPFLIVRTVTYKSPASDAGLKPDDLILNFGSLNYENFKSMLDVKSICEQAHSANMPVLVKITRKRTSESTTTGDNKDGAAVANVGDTHKTPNDDTTTIHINLRPRTWSGAGLLGCYVEALPRAAAATK